MNVNEKKNVEVTKELKEELLKGFSEYLDNQAVLCTDNVYLMEILPKLLKLQNDKGLIYGRSFCRHGEISIFMNLDRKYDRISNIMSKAMTQGTDTLHSEQSATPTETFLDTIVDLAIYSLMWTGYIRDLYPDEYKKFITLNKLCDTCD